ncbi:MAG TPA: hypothetical protein VM056_07025 [Terriglobales bacterium]|nr:hypothetical protein [Terriglobales bacterium]
MAASGESRENMNCAEFHKELPFLIGEGDKLENDPHLRSCANCSSLVKDLQYIADQAKLLLPMHDPNPRVWNNIQTNLEREGLISGGRSSRLGLTAPSQPSRWSPMVWAAGLAAVLLVGIGIFQANQPADSNVQTAALNTTADPAEAQLLSTVEKRSPALKRVYETNLKNVNAYIADARESVQKDPNDGAAREHLREAYAQKAMLYDMAASRSTE